MNKELDQKSRREPFALYGSGFFLVLLGFLLAYQFVEPAPPKSVSIATGSPQNAYFQFATQYSETLATQGINLDVKSTAGSVENLQLLKDGSVDIAFVQSGIPVVKSPGFKALASLYFEPLWLFYRQDLTIQYLTDLKGLRIAIGTAGSGTQSVTQRLLAKNGINEGNTEFLTLSGSDAVTSLNKGVIDAIFMVTSPKSPLVKQLLADNQLSLFSFERAAGYERLYRFLSSVTLPVGVIDMQHNIPAEPITLLAPTATLVVREDFHSALAVLLLQATTQIHGQGGLFETPKQFPSAQFVDYPLQDDAVRYHQSGPPFLQRYLPFWAANLIDRLIIMLIPLLTLLIPLSKVLPPTYRWRIRSRIYRWYDQLRDLDFRTERVENSSQVEKLLKELQMIEKDVMQLAIPKSYADNQYNLRLHISLIQERLERKKRHLQANN